MQKICLGEKDTPVLYPNLPATLLAAAAGQPDRLRCVVRCEWIWPRPLQPGVGHFMICSCIANTMSLYVRID